MAEWLVEDGIGGWRAGLVAGGRIVEMAEEWDDDPRPRVGSIVPGRLTRRADATGRGLATLDGGGVAQLAPVPTGITEGGALLLEIVREALPDGDGVKPMRVRAAPAGAAPGEATDLFTRLSAGSSPTRIVPIGALEAFGWSEHAEEAASGVVTRPDMRLTLSSTPAMMLIDVDGTLAPAELAIAGAHAAGEAIRRFGITGSIGIDLPTLTSKAERRAAAIALDTALPQPFERTAVNGFGFLQIVRRRARRSLIDRLRADPAGAAARTLLARAETSPGHGAVTLQAHADVLARIAARADWIDRLARRIGAPVLLRADPALAISAGHASRASP